MGGGCANKQIQNAAGFACADFTAAAVTNNIIPVVSTRIATGANTVVITMNAPVQACAAAQFVFTGWASEAAADCSVSGSAITLTTTTAITATDTVNVAYTNGGGAANTQIQTSAGLVIADFTAASVTNNVPTTTTSSLRATTTASSSNTTTTAAP